MNLVADRLTGEKMAAVKFKRRHPDYCAHREVPQEWQAALETIVPRTDRVSWLKIVWHPGHPVEPLNRFVIYEMEPNLDRVEPGFLADLQGQSPRRRGQWVDDPTIPAHLGGQRWHSDSSFSQLQWELHRETGCYPVLFWIIQGSNGGHVWRMNRARQLFHQAVDLPDTPNPGDLPYAEWDQRVATQIMRFDRLRKWQETQSLPWDQRTLTKSAAGLYVAQEAYADEQQYQAELFKFFDAQIHEAVYDLPLSMVPSGSDLPMLPGVPDHVAGREAVDERLRTSTAHAPWEES